MSIPSPIAKFKDSAEIKKAGKQVANNVGGGTVAAFFETNKSTLQAVLPKHVSPDRMLKIALGALRTTPKLMQCTVESLFGAVVQCAQLGLEPNTPMGHVYLIPFEKKKKDRGQWIVERTDVQMIIGYKGMLDLARRSGQIVSISAHEVCERDDFDYSYGLEETLYHKPAMGERGEIVAFYAVAKLKDGGHSFEVMSRLQVEAIRNNSQGYKAALINAERYKKPLDTPWENHFGEMGRKTVTRRLFKWLPMSIEMATAAALDDRSVIGQDQGLENVLHGDYSIADPDAPALGHQEEEFDEEESPTGEVIQEDEQGRSSGSPGPIKFTDVQSAIKTAATLDDLNEAADLIRSISNPSHTKMLNELYSQRETELNV